MNNSILFIGRLTKDPTSKVLETGDLMANFTLAVNRKNKDGETNADFPYLTAFTKLAEIVMNHLHKGDLVLVNAVYRDGIYEKEDGTRHKRIYIVAKEIQFLSSKKKEEDDPVKIENYPENAMQITDENRELLMGMEDEELPF